MSKPKNFYPSLERHNAPYRGVSSRQDYVNFHLAVTHDLLHLYNTSGYNENIKGHKNIVENNLSSIFEGTKEIELATYSAGTIKKVIRQNEKLSDLSTWTKPSLTYGEVDPIEEGWLLTPPELEKGFFELEHIYHVSAGDKLLIRFKIEDWSPDTTYQFGALNFDSAGHNFKRLESNEWSDGDEIKSSYFEHTLRFNEERDVRLAIQTTNSSNGQLSNKPLKISEFGIYEIEETEVYNRSLEEDIKPRVKSSKLLLKQIEERRF